jgi:glycosyltransferase involved in cell wall biosynthesis
MKLLTMLFRRDTDGVKPQCLQDNAHSTAGEAVRVMWFLGPQASSWNGVSQYSLVLIQALSCHSDFQVKMIDIPAKPRSLKRYWWQFAVYPLRAFRGARSCGVVLLYQEDLSFLIPIIRLAGGRVCVLVHHVQRTGQARGAVEKLKNWYIRLMQPMIAKADLVLVPSEVTAREVLEIVPLSPDRLRIVPNPFDDRYTSLDTPHAARVRARVALQKRFGLSMGDAFVLLNVGSDETRKNNVTLFRALATMARKDIVVVRVGSAINLANRHECMAIAAAAGVQAYFIDRVDDEELRYFYQGADAHVSPSLQEGFGRTVIEAQMAGIPVIASALQVYRDTMRDSFLAVSDPTDPVAWATEITRLVDDPSLASELAQRGKKNSQRFSSHVVCSLLCSSLHSIVQSNRDEQRL